MSGETDHGSGVPQGLHTVSAHGGSIVMRHARVEKCGQRGFLGRYCLHMHLKGSCRECLYEGNAVEWGEQRGVSIHGTHDSTFRGNVMYDVKGANIYVEDGNEMRNKVESNVAVCPHRTAQDGQSGGCKAHGTDNDQGDDLHQSGIWALSANNDFIGNRMAGFIEGLFLQTTAFGFGKGLAQNRVCAMHTPFGRFEGNVNHGNWRFGMVRSLIIFIRII